MARRVVASTLMAEAGGLQVQSQPGYIARPCLKKKKKKTLSNHEFEFSSQDVWLAPRVVTAKLQLSYPYSTHYPETHCLNSVCQSMTNLLSKEELLF
jgi:hypothetical protein